MKAKQNQKGLYSKEVMQHFLKPKNMGKIKNPDGIGKAGNPVCGDVMYLYIKVGKRKKTRKSTERTEEYIKDIKFETLGCAVAIAVSSVLTEMVKGKSLEDAEKISEKEIVKRLGGIPKQKFHCSLLGKQALLNAIKDYKKRAIKHNQHNLNF
ncbi:MAG: iron-sulfur cluster assembly scaffold protein [Candidatus Pacearchaeota archaeon]